jgi:hypothetical protein
MIKKCIGCEEELKIAIEFQNKYGYSIATGDKGTIGLEDVTHLSIVMIDDEGNIIID